MPNWLAIGLCIASFTFGLVNLYDCAVGVKLIDERMHEEEFNRVHRIIIGQSVLGGMFVMSAVIIFKFI